MRLLAISEKEDTVGVDRLDEDERALLLTVPFLLTAEQIGPSFPDRYKRKIVALRRTQAPRLRDAIGNRFIPISDDNYIPRLTVLENAIYGRVALMAGAYAEEIENEVAEVLAALDMRRRVTSIIYDLPAGLGGANLPTVIQERAAFSSAGIKRPDVLILDKALASHDSQSRAATRAKLQQLLPDTTMIFMEDHFVNPHLYDIHIEIKNGRLGDVKDAVEEDLDLDERGADDLRRKMRIIASTPLFENLSPKNQRLLAFSAQWYKAEAGQVIFDFNQRADAAYLCLKGEGELRWPEMGPDDPPLTTITPGRLIGDLAIIMNEERQIRFTASQPSTFLRIGAEEFRAVMENDASVALSLLQAVAGHLLNLSSRVREGGLMPDVISAQNNETNTLQDLSAQSDA